MKKLALIAAISAVSSASFAACPAGTAGSCENDANGAACDGSFPVAVAVDTSIRDLLQENAFGAGSACIGNDTTLCMPGISSAEFNTLAAGAVASWSQVTASTDVLGLCGISSALATGQAAKNKSGSGVNTGEATVAAAETCMTAVVPAKGAATRKIGVLPTSSAGADFRFIKLDGVAPLLAEHLSANYNLVANYAGAADLSGLNGGTAAAGAPTKNQGGVCDSASAPTIQQATPVIIADTP